MITAVCLNPSLDRTLVIDGFAYGGLNRVRGSRCDAGGKGFNVAVTASALGAQAECVGLMFRQSAPLFETRLRACGTGGDFVWLDGSARTNLKVFDREAGVVTEFNAPGRPVPPEALEAVDALVRQHAVHADALVLSGSLPPGCPAGYYAHLMRLVAGTKCRCVLDADGEALREGLKARPWLLKPNRAELEALSGCKLPSVGDVRDAARRLLACGARAVAVSLGGEGAVAVDAGTALFAPPLRVDVRSTVGAGDAMAAALACGLAAGKGLAEALCMGVASASAMCMAEGSQPPARADYAALLQTVRTERI